MAARTRTSRTTKPKNTGGIFGSFQPPAPNLRLARMALEELLWTTRCIMCDVPGSTLCDECLLRLPYIDRWRACPRCGAPDGLLVCTECNTFSLGELGLERLPFDGCVNAIRHRGKARQVITGYKDGGERRLARDIAGIMSRCTPRRWMEGMPTVTYVPADRQALRRRGFDHMEEIARCFCEENHLDLALLLEKSPSSDQRGLTRKERFRNMRGCLQAVRAPMPGSVILLDDVHTTGATLYASCGALRTAGVRDIRCVTFARVA